VNLNTKPREDDPVRDPIADLAQKLAHADAYSCEWLLREYKVSARFDKVLRLGDDVIAHNCPGLRNGARGSVISVGNANGDVKIDFGDNRHWVKPENLDKLSKVMKMDLCFKQL